MSAPTVWEEGRWSGSRVTRFSIFACSVLAAANILLTGQVDRLFDGSFVVVCLVAALAIRPEQFFNVGILPPILLLGLCVVLGVVARDTIADADDGFFQAVVAGLAHHSGGLLVGYALALVVLAIRTRFLRRTTTGRYSNRAVSPAPYRMTSGAPPVKSTTVVGNEPHSPESITASST